MNADGGTGEAMEIGGGRRLAAGPDVLSVDVRSRGVWVRSRVIPYEDIRAVYRYERLNTKGLVTLSVLWLGLLAVVFIWGTTAGWQGRVVGLAMLLISVVLGSLAFFRARTSPARLLRIEAYSGVLIVPDRSPAFFRSVAARLQPPETPPSGTAPAFAPGVEPPAAPNNSPAENSDLA